MKTKITLELSQLAAQRLKLAWENNKEGVIEYFKKCGFDIEDLKLLENVMDNTTLNKDAWSLKNENNLEL